MDKTNWMKLHLLSSGKVVTPDVESKYQAAVTCPLSQTCWTPAAGFSSADESAILTSEGVARIRSGITWGEVYAWLEGQNLPAIGGRDQQVRLGGFLLGGSMGALLNLYGLGSDGVRNFEVLLANGRQINANANENADLHRVLKGGGSNYGIVTQFDLETHPLINVQHTINLYNPDGHVETNKATVAVQKAMEDDPKIGLLTTFNNGFVAVGLLYGDTPAEPPSAFEFFYNFKNLMTMALPTTNGALLSLAQAMGNIQVSQKRATCTVTTQVSQELYEEVYKSWTEVCKTLPSGCVLHYTIQLMGKAGVQAGKDRGENIMGHESIPQCWWVFTCEWPQEGGDDAAAAQQAVDTLSEMVHSLARGKGLLLDF
ncbi:hypothetical protein BDV38DRAFT_295494 [Aspergillus pseudotamarii]|uniref:FAD-binding PCMH-type domain-containing protein n=1 Tax=Aspergillus pseudotamarii TaxID=132259 RepID=A0A5N6SHZ7_ASPPS|nr:uncharacterized protein BDV38DRAFT_295494 [Aspergillus pseudotamarii]KAE8134245.1 hypothetical protein BDV38DRAFT_295494 [Aspergillus pseudotamarii]